MPKTIEITGGVFAVKAAVAAAAKGAKPRDGGIETTVFGARSQTDEDQHLTAAGCLKLFFLTLALMFAPETDQGEMIQPS